MTGGQDPRQAAKPDKAPYPRPEGGAAHGSSKRAPARSQGARAPSGRSLRFAVAWWLLFLAACATPYYMARWAGVFLSHHHLAELCRQAQAFPTTHPITTPTPGNMTSYHAADASLIAWQGAMNALYEQVESMAVLSAGGAEAISFGFEGGGGGGFVLQRDMSIALFMAVAGAVYLSDAIALAAFVFHANLYALLVCTQVKRMNDIVQVLAGDLQRHQQELLLLPLGRTHEEVSAHLALMTKLDNMADYWRESSLGLTLVVPLLTSLTISINIILSIVGATSARCLQVVLYGFYPRLPSLATLLAAASRHLAARTASLDHLHDQHRRAMEQAAQAGGGGAAAGAAGATAPRDTSA